MREVRGNPVGAGRKFAIVVSRFNEYITSKLLAAALKTLEEHGCKSDDVICVYVPGALEIGPTAMRLADTMQYHAIICLGCVIRGETPHFEYVAGQAAACVAQVAMETGVPTAFGVITANAFDQALARCGDQPGNKGVEAALCAMEMADLFANLPRPDLP